MVRSYSNSKPELKVLWDDLSKSFQILVCYSTYFKRRVSIWIFSPCRGATPPPQNPLAISEKSFFQQFISWLPSNQFFEVSVQNYRGTLLCNPYFSLILLKRSTVPSKIHQKSEQKSKFEVKYIFRRTLKCWSLNCIWSLGFGDTDEYVFLCNSQLK